VAKRIIASISQRFLGELLLGQTASAQPRTLAWQHGFGGVLQAPGSSLSSGMVAWKTNSHCWAFQAIKKFFWICLNQQTKLIIVYIKMLLY
jgi:hypothetical protein